MLEVLTSLFIIQLRTNSGIKHHINDLGKGQIKVSSLVLRIKCTIGFDGAAYFYSFYMSLEKIFVGLAKVLSDFLSSNSCCYLLHKFAELVRGLRTIAMSMV